MRYRRQHHIIQLEDKIKQGLTKSLYKFYAIKFDFEPYSDFFIFSDEVRFGSIQY
jgi:hypothetical protein